MRKRKQPSHNPARGHKAASPGGRPFDEAAESPCASCPSAPCCTYLPVGRTRLETFAEVDHARFLLNFRRVELGLFRTGRWEVFYRAPCRFLDAAEARCRIHDHPEQPRICRYYNPYRCWYKTALAGGEPADFLRVDRQRLEALLPHLVFDDRGRLVDVPGWSELVELWRPFRLPEWSEGDDPGAKVPDAPDPGGGFIQVEEAALPHPVTYQELAETCSGCGAWCCRALMLSHATPASATSLDFLRFVLGFPGVTLGLSDDGWQIVVRTECREFSGGLCRLYGSPHRPLECKYLDAWGCRPRLKLGHPLSPGFLEVALDQFPRMVEPFRFDATGRVIHFPSLQELKTHLETLSRRSATIPGMGRPCHRS